MGKAIKMRSGEAVAAMMRRSAKFKHRTEQRGGSRNLQSGYLMDHHDEVEDGYDDA